MDWQLVTQHEPIHAPGALACQVAEMAPLAFLDLVQGQLLDLRCFLFLSSAFEMDLYDAGTALHLDLLGLLADNLVHLEGSHGDDLVAVIMLSVHLILGKAESARFIRKG